MKPEQQRIAIAEACGWGVFANTRPTDLPDYCSDLNAMHEAEKVFWQIDWSYRSIFNDHLANIIKKREVNRNEWNAETLLDATAAQRAEAFLRTINKWEETKL
jgi:hypothetical protein